MSIKELAILAGPFVGELYWEAGRFVPMIVHKMLKQYKEKNVKLIVLTREERFDLYGKYADILVPLRVEGDYESRKPECFRLTNFPIDEYKRIAKSFKNKYKDRFNVIAQFYPDIKKPAFLNKNQYSRRKMIYKFRPRQQNYDLVDAYLPKDKPIVVLAPRFRKGFKRNWNKWPEFYDRLSKQNSLLENFNFVICGKEGEYIPDKKSRFYDMNNIELGNKSSLVGLLLVILERAFFTFGSQSAIPNLSLIYGVDVLEFGCQKNLHTRTYNVKNTPITFVENKKYDIDPGLMIKSLRKLLNKKRRG